MSEFGLEYDERPPPAGLERIVRCVWFLRGAAPDGTPEAERVLPDGCVEIVLNLADRFERLTPEGPLLQPTDLLVGPMTRGFRIRPTGRVDLVGIRLLPGGARAWIREPLVSLRDATPDLGSLDRGPRAALVGRLADLAAFDDRYAVVCDELRRSHRPERVDPLVSAAARMIAAPVAALRIDDVADACGVSRRTLERRFAASVGMPPRTLLRIERLQRVLSADAPSGSLTERALDNGYYDPSHFLRDFRDLTGTTPGRFFGAETNRMTDVFTG